MEIWPLINTGLLIAILIALLRKQTTKKSPKTTIKNPQAQPPPEEEKQDPLQSIDIEYQNQLYVTPISIELGFGLIRLAEPAYANGLIEALHLIRNQLCSHCELLMCEVLLLSLILVPVLVQYWYLSPYLY